MIVATTPPALPPNTLSPHHPHMYTHCSFTCLPTKPSKKRKGNPPTKGQGTQQPPTLQETKGHPTHKGRQRKSLYLAWSPRIAQPGTDRDRCCCWELQPETNQTSALQASSLNMPLLPPIQTRVVVHKGTHKRHPKGWHAVACVQCDTLGTHVTRSMKFHAFRGWGTSPQSSQLSSNTLLG